MKALVKTAVLLAAMAGCVNIAMASNASDQSSNVNGNESPMKGSHVHLGVKDLPATLKWLEAVWLLSPTFQDERMAVIPLGEFSLILDVSEVDVTATVAFDSNNCDDDFDAVVARGGVPLEEPRDRPWGVRSAYIQGPGALKFEIEQAFRR